MNVEYTAGLFDGEGSITIRKIKSKERYLPTYSLLVQLSSNYRPVLDELQSEFGGSVFIGNRKRVLNGERKRFNYNWQITTNKALVFLKLIYPYLKIKKDEAGVAFEYAKIVTVGRKALHPFQVTKREELRNTLISLNTR